MPLMVYSHWLGPKSGLGQGLVLCRTFHIAQGPGRMGCMVLIRTFHTAPEQGQGRTLVFHHREHFQDLKNGYQTHSSGPEHVPGVLPCPCSGAVWKVLIKTIQPILPSPCPCPSSGPSQCEYTIILPQQHFSSSFFSISLSATAFFFKRKTTSICALENATYMIW